MKVLIIALFSCTIVFANDGIFDSNNLINGMSSGPITDPAISKRCNKLIDQRLDRLRIKQRYGLLLERNHKLQKKTPEHKQTILTFLQKKEQQISEKVKSNQEKIKNLEEKIILKGCPGINLH